MTMYTQLLGSALDERGHPDITSDIGEFLADFLSSRARLHAGLTSVEETQPELLAVTNELAYDVALVRLARRLGIECEVDWFERPLRARRSLEKVLVTRGIPLEEPRRRG